MGDEPRLTGVTTIPYDLLKGQSILKRIKITTQASQTSHTRVPAVERPSSAPDTKYFPILIKNAFSHAHTWIVE